MKWNLLVFIILFLDLVFAVTGEKLGLYTINLDNLEYYSIDDSCWQNPRGTFNKSEKENEKIVIYKITTRNCKKEGFKVVLIGDVAYRQELNHRFQIPLKDLKKSGKLDLEHRENLLSSTWKYNPETKKYSIPLNLDGIDNFRTISNLIFYSIIDSISVEIDAIRVKLEPHKNDDKEIRFILKGDAPLLCQFVVKMGEDTVKVYDNVLNIGRLKQELGMGAQHIPVFRYLSKDKYFMKLIPPLSSENTSWVDTAFRLSGGRTGSFSIRNDSLFFSGVKKTQGENPYTLQVVLPDGSPVDIGKLILEKKSNKWILRGMVGAALLISLIYRFLRRSVYI